MKIILPEMSPAASWLSPNSPAAPGSLSPSPVPRLPNWLGERSELPGGPGGYSVRPPGDGMRASLTRWPGLPARSWTPDPQEGFRE